MKKKKAEPSVVELARANVTVRLSEVELEQLDQIGRLLDCENRSQTVRALIRERADRRKV